MKRRFHLIGAMNLIPNGNCNAGKGDFILLPESVALQKEPLYGKTDDEFAKRLDSKEIEPRQQRCSRGPHWSFSALFVLDCSRWSKGTRRTVLSENKLWKRHSVRPVGNVSCLSRRPVFWCSVLL